MHAFSIDSDDALCEENSERGDEHTTTFSKKRASTTEECRLSGAFNSLLNAAALKSYCSSSITSSSHGFYSAANGDGVPCSPLIIHTPFFVQTPQELSKGLQKLLPLSVEQGSALADASISWHQWLVILFAGRRANPSTWDRRETKSSTAMNSVREHQVRPALKSSIGTTVAGTVSGPQVPRLTLEQVIPQIRTVRAEHECSSHCSSYANVFPARTTQYTGYAVVARDEYHPATVQ